MKTAKRNKTVKGETKLEDIANLDHKKSTLEIEYWSKQNLFQKES